VRLRVETHFKVGGGVTELIRPLSDFANWGTGLIKGFAMWGGTRTDDRVAEGTVSRTRESESAK